jgi:hypothetical protein
LTDEGSACFCPRKPKTRARGAHIGFVWRLSEPGVSFLILRGTAGPWNREQRGGMRASSLPLAPPPRSGSIHSSPSQNDIPPRNPGGQVAADTAWWVGGACGRGAGRGGFRFLTREHTYESLAGGNKRRLFTKDAYLTRGTASRLPVAPCTTCLHHVCMVTWDLRSTS